MAWRTRPLLVSAGDPWVFNSGQCGCRCDFCITWLGARDVQIMIKLGHLVNSEWEVVREGDQGPLVERLWWSAGSKRRKLQLMTPALW